MRTFIFSIGAALLVSLLSGCTTHHNALVLDRVGPEFAGSANGEEGSLMVFSAPDHSAHFNTVPYRPIYSDYRILLEDGKLLQDVSNRDARRNSPNVIKLPAGNYSVLARANGYGDVTVPVLIVPGRLTVVHLEGPGSWLNASSVERSNLVCLTGGEIVGYRAPSTVSH